MAFNNNAISNLSIVTLEGCFDNQFKAWCEDNNIFYLEGCTRTTIFTDKEKLKAAPITPEAEVLEEAEAYQFLLEVLTGLRSKARGEEQIVGQFKTAWRTFEEKNPLEAKTYCKLFQSLMADNNLIRNHITPDLAPAYYERVARDLVPADRMDNIMVMVDFDKKGRLTNTSKNILRQLGRKSKNSGGITITTAPNDSQSINVFRALKKNLPRSLTEKIMSTGGIVDFSDYFSEDGMQIDSPLNKISTLYVTYPMGKDEAVDEAIIKTWEDKQAYCGYLVHLGGEKRDRKSTERWLNTKLCEDFFYPPESITQDQVGKKDLNEVLIRKGTCAAQICSKARTTGEKVNLETITSDQQYIDICNDIEDVSLAP